MEPDEVNVAKMIEPLEIAITFKEGDIITDAIVLARVSNPNNRRSSFYYGTNKDIDTITRLGMMCALNQLEDQTEWEDTDRGEEDGG